MENKHKLYYNPARFNRMLGILLAIALVVFEVIICVQFTYNAKQEIWKIVSLVGCSVALDALFLVELYLAKTLRARIIIYCVDFVFLLFICSLTGSTYLAGLYCVTLSQFYINVEDFKSKVVVFVVSLVMYIVTCFVGWYLNNHRALGATEVMDMMVAAFVGELILAVHFGLANFLISFYRNNLKLTKALNDASESKKQLEEAYQQLSETAVFQERNRIARDIHDNAGHSMTAVIMQTEAAKLLIDSDPAEAKRKIISANMQAKTALEQMRESVHLLAGRTEPYSLKEEVEEVLAQTADGTDVKIVSNIEDVSLSGGKRRFIVGSLKECLSNGMRHGGANAFYVELSESENIVRLTVSDNGAGLPSDFKEGFGIRGIREKATTYGGGIVFESESGDGCEINITLRADDGGKNDD